MKDFLGKDFLLSNDIASELYHSTAASLPIIDFHNHLSPKDIFENRRYKNITEMWLEEDHYKWRAMRANGVSESYITGNAAPREKFTKWAETVPYAIRNPLYHWTHMELKNPFGIDSILNPESANSIFDKCNEQLQNDDKLRVRGLLKSWKVELLCTTDDPLDDLKYHRKILEDSTIDIAVLPTFRADNLLRAVEPDFLKGYVNTLGELTDIEVNTWTDFQEAIAKRHTYFHDLNCSMFDVSFPVAPVAEYTESDLDTIISSIQKGKELTPEQIEQYRAGVLLFICALNAQKGWTQQFHIGPLRNNNSVMLNSFGPDAGCDSMDDLPQARSLSVFLDRLRKKDELADTILYNLNPAHNAVFATLVGNFNDNSRPGKMQFGAAWWFLDQKQGIIENLNAISNFGLLRRFVGMLTDSRSFLSYSRHEYFRRILCDLIGRDVINGEIPNDMELLKQLVEEVCYLNAKHMFIKD